MRIILATTGQPSTNPRLVKEANALTEAGHEVKIYYCFWANWANETDQELLQNIDWDYQLVGGSPLFNRTTFFFNKIKFKCYQHLSKYSNAYLEQFRCKSYTQLISALKKEKADHFIAHNLGALAPVAKAAKHQNTSFSFDAEDFHRGQYQHPCRDQEIDILLENKYIPKAKFVTTASPLINEHYQAIYPHQKFTTINNVFPKKEFSGTVSFNANAPLKLVWFSQTIGLNRGLENILEAVNAIKEFSVEINLFGEYNTETKQLFTDLLKNKQHKSNFFKPLSQKELHQKLSQFDIGIAAEIVKELNRDICLTNKIFSYIQAGLCVLASNTQAQSQLLYENPNIGFLYNGDIKEDIIWILKDLNHHRELLLEKKKSSLELAETMNWDNEKVKFLNLIND